MRTPMRVRLGATMLMTAVALGPRPASAQVGCVYGCSCSRIGCGCSTGGSGNGSSCDATGTSCKVMKCNDIDNRTVGFAADGSVLDLRSVAPRFFAAAGDDATAATSPAPSAGRASWEYVEPGHSVARRCDGLILAHAWEPAAAESVRRRSGTISI